MKKEARGPSRGFIIAEQKPAGRADFFSEFFDCTMLLTEFLHQRISRVASLRFELCAIECAYLLTQTCVRNPPYDCDRHFYQGNFPDLLKELLFTAAC